MGHMITKQKTRKSTLYRKEKFVAVAFILLPLIGFSLFMVATLFLSGVMSLTQYFADGSVRIGSIINYRDIFTNPHPLFSQVLPRAIGTTLVLLLGIPISMVCGLLVAIFLNSKLIKGKKVFRMLMYLPAISSAIAVNIVFSHVFHHHFGIINIITPNMNWLYGRNIWFVIILRGVWGGLGINMLLYLAGLKNVPRTYYEAAEIDGANGLQRFFKITLPLLTPVTFFLLITGIIGGMQSFADSAVINPGNPHSHTIVYVIWEYGIHHAPLRTGFATAVSLLLAAVIMVITIIQFKVSNKWVYTD